MNLEERRGLIRRYAEGPDEVVKGLEGFPPYGLTAHPIPGKWSACEIVHHLADSESISAIRLRRLLAEERPVIQGYDQEEFARRLRYNERALEPALRIFRGVREATVPLLDAMSDEDWGRQGWHSESGLYTPERWLEIYAAHAHGHASQIQRLKESLGSR